MSDLMLLGILRMPLDDTPEGLGVIAWTQIKSVMREAANRIEADAARIAELTAALKPFADKVEYTTGTNDDDYMDPVFKLGECRAARAALEKNNG
jgi:hypothetical protein